MEIQGLSQFRGLWFATICLLLGGIVGCTSQPDVPKLLAKHAQVRWDKNSGFKIDLQFAQVDRRLMKAAVELPNLTTLVLSDSQLADHTLAELAHCTSLRTLALNHTSVTDADLVHLQGLTSLEHLELGGTQITDGGLLHLRGLVQLHTLSLADTVVTDNGLANLANLPLRELSLNGTQVTDVGLIHLAGSSTLENLNLRNTSITGTGLKHLRPVTSLKTLALAYTPISTAGTNVLAQLPHLERLDLAFTGTGDAELKTLSAVRGLTSLNLHGTAVTELSGAPGIPDSKPTNDSSEEHWAFRPLHAPSLPHVQDDVRVVTGIDCFIQSALEEQGLGIGAEADRATLIRRVSFDLTGLPPTAEELTAFLADASADAYPSMVERYLASPRYGDYRGKRWLETAGYADSNGYFDADSDRPLAYRYRDYVIRSINADKPFDRFVREQLAGDEFSGYGPDVEATPEMIELLEATHFLRNVPDGTGESGGNPQELLQDRYAVLEANVEVLSSVLFGLTLQCAKCHDHKFEPVTQREYFGLMALLTPAFNPEQWLSPNERFVQAASPAESAAFTLAVKTGKASDLNRPGMIAAVRDLSPVPPDLYIPENGDYQPSGSKAEPTVPRILDEADHPFSIPPPLPGASTTGYRLAFADWLTRPGSRPAALMARLQVNRIWQLYFGRGLSTTPANFGHSGNTPTHPELLEWLTGQFVNSEWSLKSLHRLILNSAVYRQTSALDPVSYQTDPENRLLWRMPLRRLDAESIRDSLLAVSGDLDLRMGGQTIPAVCNDDGEVVVYDTSPDGKRRSIYLPHRRTQVPTILQIFDSPSIVTNCVERNASTVPLQSLTLLNSEFVLNRAASFARRLAREAGPDSDARIMHAFQLAYARQPDAAELRAALQFLRNQSQQYQGKNPAPQQRTWADFCHTLLVSSEFLYVE